MNSFYLFFSLEKLSASALRGTSLFTFNFASTQTTRRIFRRCDNVGRDASIHPLPVQENIKRLLSRACISLCVSTKTKKTKKPHQTEVFDGICGQTVACSHSQSQSNTSKLFFVLKTEANVAVPARKSAQIKGRGNDTPLREQVHRHDS